MTSRATLLLSSLMPTESSQLLEMPSPHLTGAPISERFSIMRTRAPFLAAYFAVMAPAGPAPTTTISYSEGIYLPPASFIAPTGQTLMHRLHIVQSSLNSSTNSFRKIAFTGHEPTHAPQRMHLVTSTLNSSRSSAMTINSSVLLPVLLSPFRERHGELLLNLGPVHRTGVVGAEGYDLAVWSRVVNHASLHSLDIVVV